MDVDIKAVEDFIARLEAELKQGPPAKRKATIIRLLKDAREVHDFIIRETRPSLLY